jgi:hypothetical protein
MIDINEEGLCASKNPQDKYHLKVLFYEWFRELGPDQHMAAFSAICGIARGRFRNRSLATAISEIKKLISPSDILEPDSESLYLPEEIAFIESLLTTHVTVAQGLTPLELQKFIMEQVYGLTE